jgi:hypothetical protein
MTISQPVKAAGDVTLLAGGISGTPFDPTGSMTINAPVTSTSPQGLVTIQGEGGISIGTGGVLTANTIALFSFSGTNGIALTGNAALQAAGTLQIFSIGPVSEAPTSTIAAGTLSDTFAASPVNGVPFRESPAMSTCLGPATT